MVEIRLELEQSSSDRSRHIDCFVSVRLGEHQRMSPLSSKCTYRFPRSNEAAKQGKIEIFKRVAVARVSVNPCDDPLVVSMPSSELEPLAFKMCVLADDASKEKHRREDVKGARAREAKEYLQKHSVEACLAEAMQALLRERPDNPTEFLASAILSSQISSQKREVPVTEKAPKATGLQESLLQKIEKKVGSATGNDVAACIAGMPLEAREKLERSLAEVSTMAHSGKTPVAHPPVILDSSFREYYCSSIADMGSNAFGSVYSKFPTKDRLACTQSAQEHQQAAAASIHGGPFELMPSVGSWCQPLRGHMRKK
jgi:hypothetical protein